MPRSAVDEPRRLIIVSNRLPVVLQKRASDRWEIKPGSGGLVTALAPVLRHRGGTWIGWSGTVEEQGVAVDRLLAQAASDSGYQLRAVNLTARERDLYYGGFANEVVWPLFHDLPSRCVFDPAYWQAYREVNGKFARAIEAEVRGDDFVWVHDYHLMMVGSALRSSGMENRLGFFLHVPFPSPDIFLKLPWRFQILHNLLAFDLIGFQTQRDRRNFVSCVKMLVDHAGVTARGGRSVIRHHDREVHVGAFPISIDYHEFDTGARSAKVADAAWYIHEEFPERQIILGVDRLDYTKGIPEKLRAFHAALGRYPELEGNVTLVQVVVPSRREIPEYARLRSSIEQLVGRINGEFSRPGWVPVHYHFYSLMRERLLAFYRTAETCLVTSWKDGMNLVAKEYCAANIEEDGVLILSEFAGATAQLHRHTLVVNPHDIDGVAEAIWQAFHMPREERRERMRKLRQSVRRQGVFWWVNAFLNAAFDSGLDSFPLVEDYVPRED